MALSAFNIYQQLTGVRAVSVSNFAGRYYNGSSNNGVGATLTASSSGVLVMDGVTLQLGDRVLLASQTNSYENGIYVVRATGSLSAFWILERSDDFHSVEQMQTSLYVPVAAGTLNAGAMFTVTEPFCTAVGVAPINFTSTTKITSTTGVLLNVQAFTSSGTYTPTPGTQNIVAILVGGGGGGSSAAGTNLVSPTDGGTTSLGSLCSATGGEGGGGSNFNVGGAGGTATGGLLNINGGYGFPSGHATSGPGGNGGSTIFGGAGGSGAQGGTNGGDGAPNSGAGGGAGFGDSDNLPGSGGGSGGLCIGYFENISGTYAVTVGAGGTMGTCDGAPDGGNGGSGSVIIFEFT